MTTPPNPLAALIEALRKIEGGYVEAEESDPAAMLAETQAIAYQALAALPANAGECVLVERALIEEASQELMNNYALVDPLDVVGRGNARVALAQRLRAAAGVGKV